jgi:hypothetical protein
MWLGLLYAMMCLAVQFFQLSASPVGEPSSQSPRAMQKTIQSYREKAAQALVLGKYTRCPPYTMETLFLYFVVEFYLKTDTNSGKWILLGVIVRTAMRMGYHRDPSHSPQITPFQGEMRRRLWMIIAQIDIVLSSHIGLPRMINPKQCDSKEPRNLADEDLDEAMTELTPGRPESVSTPILYMIVKSRILSVFGMIVDIITSVEPVTYAEVMRLDSILLETVAAIPAPVRPRPMANSITDDAEIIMRRVYIAILIRKSQCVLHYRYLIAGRTDSRYIYSRQSCIDAAIDILQYQSMLYEETKPGGQLQEVKWKVSIIIAEFLLTATILCVYLDREMAANSPNSWSREILDEKREEVQTSLRESDRIWSRASNQSPEAQKAAAAVRVVLGKVDNSRLVSLSAKRDYSLQSPVSDRTSISFSQGQSDDI